MWRAYEAPETTFLAIALILLAGAVAYVGIRLPRPISVQRPGGTVTAFMLVIWVLTICTFLVAVGAYLTQMKQVFHLPPMPRPTTLAARGGVRVGTFPDAFVTFWIIFYLTRRRFGWKVALGSAFVGTAAAPMLFELPFDLIVMGRTYPTIPPNPTLYRALFFLPLFLIELSTISLLALLPSMRITRSACYALAGMFAVFAAWAVFGFSYPGEPLPRVLNVISKMLCFVTAIFLFVWTERSEVGDRQTGRR
jgi:hypothetical protein